MTVERKTWQAIALEAQQRRDASIASPLIQPPVPPVPDVLPADVTLVPRQVLDPEDVRITELSIERLLLELRSGTLPAERAAQAFLRRAGVAQRLANCVTELLAESALAQAAELDRRMASGGGPVGALHGLPISIKEHVSMAGLGLSLGYVGRYGAGLVGEEDALLLKILGEAGAVVVARTTEPQTIMHLECSSNLYGVTLNPHNTALSSGGSSGGEGALAALRGSCLGVGTDIGGSIRSPAGNCGVYGLRPTAGRLPYLGVEAAAVGTGGVEPVQGPLSASLAGLRIYCEAMLRPRPWRLEPALVPIPWGSSSSSSSGDNDGEDGEDAKAGRRPWGRRPLRVGVMWHDGVVRPHPPVARALREVVAGLDGDDDIQMLDFTGRHPDHAEGWAVIASLYYADGGDCERAELDASGEPMRPLTRWLLEHDGHVRRLPMEQLWAWQQRRHDFCRAYNRAWEATAGTGPAAAAANYKGGSGSSSSSSGIDTGEASPLPPMDVLLCPYFPGASGPPDSARYWAYTSTWNLTDQPALVFPVTKVDPELDGPDPSPGEPLSDADRRNRDLYNDDPHRYAGAPVSLQLVARRFEEEKLLAAAELLVERLGLPFVPMLGGKAGKAGA